LITAALLVTAIGRFGGLAVFNRALTEVEMTKLHSSAKVSALNEPQP